MTPYFDRIARMILGFGVLLSPGTHAADFPDSQSPPFLVRSWQTEQGLPHNMISAITQTRDGYLWLGTAEGLARFDGVQCRVFGLLDGFRALEISALLEDRAGALWLGTVGGGLSRRFRDHIDTFNDQDGLTCDSINALLEDQDGDLWVGATTGLFRWRDGRFKVADEKLGAVYVRALAKDSQGGVWVSTLQKGLVCFHNRGYTFVPGPQENRQIDAYQLLVDSQNRLWAGLQNGIVLCRENGQWTKYGPENGLPPVFINTLAQTSDGVIWAGSLDEGLYYLKNGRFHPLRIRDGLSDDAIDSLFADRQQNIWVGTRSGGLDRLSPKKLSVCHVMEDAAERLPLSLAQTTNGDLWVAASGHGIFHLSGTNFEQLLNMPPASGHRFVGALLGARDGSLWWGAGPAVFRWKEGALLSSYDQEPWLRGDRVLSLCENGSDGMWVGTYNGQVRLLQAGQFNAITGLPGKPMCALAQETNGTLWIGSMGAGLFRLQHSKLTTFTVKDGLPSNLIRTLYLDAEGTLWIGTVSGGLSRWSQGVFANYTASQGLIDDTVQQILEDDNGWLWLGCNRGICGVSKQSLETLAAGNSSFIYPVVFGQPEGMLSEQCEGNFNAGVKTASGKLCFSTAKGIVIIDPSKRTRPVSPPVVLLENVWVDGNPGNPWFHTALDAAGNEAEVPIIPPGHGRFEFHYTGLGWNAPEKIRFRYRLEGLESDWTEAGGERKAIYSYVPPGHYSFHVVACNSDGMWNDTGATVAFVVLPHFWQMAWFSLTSVLIVLGLTTVGIRYLERRRFRARLKRLEQEQAMECERERIARDLHDELGSSLTRISMLSDLVHTRNTSAEQLKTRVEKISVFAVRTTRSLDEIVWAVNPQNDSLRCLLEYLTQFARELFEDTGINCRFEIPDELPGSPLPPEMRHHVFLVVKEALTNALKHSQGTEVFLCAQFSRHQMDISVQDNGAGFEPALTPNNAMQTGLKNMRQRMESLGGRLSIQSAPGQGTVVAVSVHCPDLESPGPAHRGSGET